MGDTILDINNYGLDERLNQIYQLLVSKTDIIKPVLKQEQYLIAHYSNTQVNIPIHYFVTMEPHADTMSVLYFLEQFEICLSKFLNRPIQEINDRVIKDHLLLITEIYNECVSDGIVQTVDYEVLKMFVQMKNQYISRQQLNKQEITIQATKQSNYRSPGISYKKNKLDILINEQLNIICDNFNIISGSAYGQIIIDNQLSGMPDVTLQLNTGGIQQNNNLNKTENAKEKVVISQITYHSCVNVNKQDTLTFVPPDGKFVLGKYQIGNEVSNPFKCQVSIGQITKYLLSAILQIKSLYSINLSGENIAVKIPLPQNTIQCILDTDRGKAKENKQGTYINWLIGTLPGQQSCILKFTIKTEFNPLSYQDLRQEKRKNIWMKFKINNYTASGINVLSAKVVSPLNYQTEKRYGCQVETDQYQIQW